MRKLICVTLACAGIACAQGTAGAASSFQYIASEKAAGFRIMSLEGITSSVVKGRPFSATEERHTVQTLGDGTRIENKETNKIYRDDQGRTRIERSNGSVMIQDPNEGAVAETGPQGETARRAVYTRRVAGPATADVEAGRPMKIEAERKADIAVVSGRSAAFGKGEEQGNVLYLSGAIGGPVTQIAMDPPKATTLGFQNIGGVSAEGTRSVIEIPAGQIGNNRPIQVINERWYSNDLQMTVKTLNSDPRFGDTTYELTNIVQGAQDPALFVMPQHVPAPPMPPPAPPVVK